MNREIEKKTKELIDILAYFQEIKVPPYKEIECPFRDDHYDLSQATSGIGCWGWNCRLCGKEFTE